MKYPDTGSIALGQNFYAIGGYFLNQNYKIQCLVPDLPSPQDVMPFLEEMGAGRWYSNFGPLCRRFEQAMQAFLTTPDTQPDFSVVTFTSATTALEAALRVLGLREGAHVLLPALTFPATATAVINAGYIPVFSDVCEKGWDLTPEIARAVCARQSIDAVMPVAVYGRPVDVDKWDAFADEAGLPVVVDAAAALGQQAIGRKIHLAFSLHATKPFGVGEGGLLVTCDDQLADRARSWSNFGFMGAGGVISQVGTNAKMGEFYAATGLAQLKRWSAVVARRTKVLEAYQERLKSMDNALVWQAAENGFVPATLVVRTQGKAKLVAEHLKSKAIHTRFWYLPPLYEHPALAQYAEGHIPSQMFPVIESLKQDLIGLPFHSFLSVEDVDTVCSALEESL